MTESNETEQLAYLKGRRSVEEVRGFLDTPQASIPGSGRSRRVVARAVREPVLERRILILPRDDPPPTDTGVYVEIAYVPTIRLCPGKMPGSSLGPQQGRGERPAGAVGGLPAAVSAAGRRLSALMSAGTPGRSTARCASRATTSSSSAATGCGSTTVSRGSVVAVAADEWRDVGRSSAGDEQPMPRPRSLRDLTLARMLVSDDLDELAVLERRYRAGTADRTSFALTIVTSLGCNFDCPYCFEDKPPAILDDGDRAAAARGARRAAADDPSGSTSRGTAVSRCSRRTGSTGCPRPSWSAATAARRRLLREHRHQRLPADARRRARGCGPRVGSAQITLDGPPETPRPDAAAPNGRGDLRRRSSTTSSRAPTCCRSRSGSTSTRRTPASTSGCSTCSSSAASPGRVTVYPGRIVAYDEGIGAPSETYRPTCFTLPGVRRGRARVPGRGATSAVWPRRRCPSRSRRRAPRSGSTSSSSARAASSTSAGTRWATSTR